MRLDRAVEPVLIVGHRSMSYVVDGAVEMTWACQARSEGVERLSTAERDRRAFDEVNGWMRAAAREVYRPEATRRRRLYTDA